MLYIFIFTAKRVVKGTAPVTRFVLLKNGMSAAGFITIKPL